MRLKILHFIPYFFPEYSGTAIRLYNLLSRIPHEIKIYTSNRIIGGDIIAEKKGRISNINIKRFSLTPKGLIAIIPLLRYIYNIYNGPKILLENAQEEGFDIIHCHTPVQFAQAGRKLSKLSKKPFIFELHVFEKDYHTFRGGTLIGLYTEKKTKEIINSSDHIIVLTNSVKERMCNSYNIGKEKMTVVSNGVDIDKFAPKYTNKAEELKEKLNLADNVIMYAGYMDRINGMIDLANAIPQIITEKPNTSFVFVGHGPEENKIIALSREYHQVKFLPMVPYDEMPIYYQMCDLFIIPRPSTISAETVTPLKLLEAMAMEKPVLGSNVGGIAEVIKHGENGYLFEKGNMDSFKKTLLEMLDADNTQIGKNARKTIVENYTWDKSAKILQKVYERLV